MTSLYQILDFDAGAFVTNIHDIDNKMILIESLKNFKLDPKYLLLKLFQIVQYIDNNVALKSELSTLKSELSSLKSELSTLKSELSALKSELSTSSEGGGRKKSRKHKKRKSKKSRKHRRKTKSHSRR